MEYIEKEAALNSQRWNGRLDEYVVFVRDIESIPAADVAPVRHGRWKGEHKSGYLSHPYSITYECSECGYSMYTVYGLPPITNYCPNCGAKMEESE